MNASQSEYHILNPLESLYKHRKLANYGMLASKWTFHQRKKATCVNDLEHVRFIVRLLELLQGKAKLLLPLKHGVTLFHGIKYIKIAQIPLGLLHYKLC